MSKQILFRSIGYRLKTAILSVSLIAVGLPGALALPDNKVIATIPTSTGLPLGIAVSPNGKVVYVACRDGGAVDVINAATKQGRRYDCDRPWYIVCRDNSRQQNPLCNQCK